jgi:hypothetical protein
MPNHHWRHAGGSGSLSERAYPWRGPGHKVGHVLPALVPPQGVNNDPPALWIGMLDGNFIGRGSRQHCMEAVDQAAKMRGWGVR